EPFFERRHENSVRDPFGRIAGRRVRGGFGLQLLRDGAGFEAKFAEPLEEEDGAISGFGHPCTPASSMSITTASRFRPDRITQIAFPGATPTSASSINDARQIVGVFRQRCRKPEVLNRVVDAHKSERSSAALSYRDRRIRPGYRCHRGR